MPDHSKDSYGSTGVPSSPLRMRRNYPYTWRYGWAWIGGYLRRGKIIPALRQVYWVLARGYDSEGCADCGRPYPLWHAPDDLWARFSGNTGLCCPSCFDRRACEQGVRLRWRPEIA